MNGPTNGPERADEAAAPSTIGRRDSLRVAVASLVSAGSGFVILLLATYVLVPKSENTVFQTFWATTFACFGVLSGLSIETTRAVAASAPDRTGDQPGERPGDRPGGRPGPQVLAVGLLLGLGAGAVVAATSPWWAASVFPSGRGSLAFLVAGGVVAYAAHSVVVGALAGRRSWVVYARLIGADALVRLALVGVVVAVGATVAGLAAATVGAATTWVWFLLASSRARAAARSRADSGTTTFLRRIGATSLAAGASAMLVVGFPVLLAVTTPAAEYATAAPLLLAISLTRAPMLIPLNAYQGVAVTHFVAHRDRGLAALLPVLRLVGLVGVVATAGAYALGPWLVRTLLPAGYEMGGPVLAGLTAAAVLLALLTLTGALCQALTLHATFLGGWIVAVVVAILLLLLPLSLEARCVIALAGGPLVGIAVHLLRLRRAAAVAVGTTGTAGATGTATTLEPEDDDDRA